MSETSQGEVTPEASAPAEPWEPHRFHARLHDLQNEYKNQTFLRWHHQLQRKFTLHPVVEYMVQRYRPKYWEALALEYPYVSEKDPLRLAYTRSPADGAAERQLVTSIGKYLSRHWPDVSDHHRRDAQALFTPDTMYIVTTTPEIVVGVENGPRSCMASVYGSIPFRHDVDHVQMNAWLADPIHEPEPAWALHPYSAYRPDLGWSMALRKHEGSIDGRALLYVKGKWKCFVRTYRRNLKDMSGWSETDFSLHGWLENQGYTKLDSWPEGVQLFTPDSDYSRISAPYLDGIYRRIEEGGSHNGFLSRLVHGDGGTHNCGNTNGTAEVIEDEDDDSSDAAHCEECDGHYHEDDMCHVGRNDDIYRCTSCRDNYWTYVTGRRGRYAEEYYIDDSVGTATGRCKYDYIDEDYPPHDVVQLSCGDWAEIDDSVCIDGEWYLAEDSDVVEFEAPYGKDGQAYGLRGDSFQDINSGWWYDENHYIEVSSACEAEETEETEVI